jgi:rSAM/selenodomain-associated transferase 2
MRPRSVAVTGARAVEVPRISVIVPALNEVQNISMTLAALQPLRSRGHEVIVSDGGSTDGTQTIAGRYADIVMLASRGRSRQMCEAVEHSSGNIYWFLHADTQPPTNADRLIIEGLAKSGRRWGRFDVQICDGDPRLRCVAYFMNLRSRITAVATGDQGIFACRDVYAAAGGFPDIPLMEDVALCRQLKRQGRPVCLRTPLRTSSRRWREHGVMRTIMLMWCLRAAYALGVDPRLLARRYDAS